MMNMRIGLALFLVVCVVSPRALCLECYECHSYVSWAECEKYQSKQICKDPVLSDTCIKAHRNFVQSNGQRRQEFIKSCYYSGECNVENCRIANDITKGSWCDLECCNTTLCNAGVTPWARKHMPQTMLSQVGGGGSHVTYASTNQIFVMLLIVLVFAF